MSDVYIVTDEYGSLSTVTVFKDADDAVQYVASLQGGHTDYHIWPLDWGQSVSEVRGW